MISVSFQEFVLAISSTEQIKVKTSSQTLLQNGDKVKGTPKVAIGERVMVVCAATEEPPCAATTVVVEELAERDRLQSSNNQFPRETNAPHSESTATLDETMSWLSSNLVRLHHSYEENEVSLNKKTKLPMEKTRRTHNVDVTVLGARADGCRLSISTQRTTTLINGKSTELEAFQIPLDQVDPVMIRTNNHSLGRPNEDELRTFVPPTYTTILIGTREEVIMRSWKLTVTASPGWSGMPDQTEQGPTNNLQLNSDDQVFANRIVNALNHGIELCHNLKKPEPF